MLFNNPKSVVAKDGGDGTYLHEDIVLQRIVEKLTPPVIYDNNKEMIDAFSQTVVNLSPVSINIMDFWNKRQLSNFVVPLPDTDYSEINPDNIYEDEQAQIKGFFVNSIKNLQERLSETYLNNFYTTAYKVRNSHTLRQKLYQIFNSFDIPMDQKNLLFNNINELFKEERFITSKDYNMKKGKKVALTYAALSAHDAEIEGPLTAQSFFLDYTEVSPLSYSVESVILPDVYNAFVKPLAHPLGIGLDYKKICKNDLTDRVFSKIKQLADGVTVKCTHPSDTLPTLPPSVLLPMGINPEWETYVAEQVVLNPLYSPYDPETWIEVEGVLQTAPPMDKYVPVLPYPSAVQNTEQITIDESLTGPWDPANPNPMPEMYFASTDGTGLWQEIAEFDEGQGNILEDIQYGYGDEEYAGMNYTKYIFQNKSYLIEYTCTLSGGDIRRIIEYYRFDVYDTSIHQNSWEIDESMPRWSNPEQYGLSSNLIHGTVDDLESYGDNPIKGGQEFGFEDDTTEATGLDFGVWGPFDVGYPDDSIPTLTLATPVSSAVVDVLTCDDSLNYITFIATAGQTVFAPSFTFTSVQVFINGVKLRDTEYTTPSGTIVLNSGLQVDDEITIIETIDAVILNDYDELAAEVPEYELELGTTQAIVYVDGYKIPQNDVTYIIKDYIDEELFLETGETLILSTKLEFQDALVANTWIQVIQSPEVKIDQFYYDVTDLQSEFEVLSPVYKLQVFVDGVRLKETEYVYVNTNAFLVPGSYSWDTRTNIITSEPQFTEIYSLGARYISTRKCIINVYNLHQKEEPTITEEFDIRTVDFEKNIINIDGETNDTNIIDDITNVTNKFQK